MAGRLLLLFIIMPIVELFLLIKVGHLIGVIPTIALVLLTAIIGSQLVRRQGFSVMQRVRDAQARGETPAVELVDGAALLFAGFLLITPGFISDTLGFLLLVPMLRQRIARKLLARVVVVSSGQSSGGWYRRQQRPHDDSIEGEYERTDQATRSDRERIGRKDR